MRITLHDLKERISNLDWDIQKVANSLSAIGHETEVVGDDQIDVTLTTNRADCKDMNVLAFDLAGVYGLGFTGQKPDLTSTKTITVTIQDVNKILGTELAEDALAKLSRLGFTVEPGSVAVPVYRTDVFEKADIAEEVGRIYGYQNIQPQPLIETERPSSESYYKKLHLKIALANIGLSETLTYSFVSEKTDWELDRPYNNDEPYLRDSLLYGLLKTVAKNPFIKRGGFFEVGQVYLRDELEYVGVVIFGFKDAAREKMIQATEEALHSTEKIEIIQIDQALLDKYEVKQSHVYFFETLVSSCKTSSEPTSLNYDLPMVKPISKFPPTVRDVSISSSSKDDALKKAADFSNPHILFYELADEFAKDDGTTSYTFKFFFQNMERSFTDQEIAQQIDQQLQQYFQQA